MTPTNRQAEKMPLPEFTVAIWVHPHRGHGYYIEIDAGNVEDGLPGGVFQSFQHVAAPQRLPEFQPDYPHREFGVSPRQLEELVGLADLVSYPFAEHPHTPTLGGCFFGLRLARGFHEAIVVWHGRYEDQEASIRKLYEAVQSLAER